MYLGRRGPGNNGDEGVLHSPQSSKTGATPKDKPFFEEVLPHCGEYCQHILSLTDIEIVMAKKSDDKKKMANIVCSYRKIKF